VRDYAAGQGVEETDALRVGMEGKSAEFRKERELYVTASTEEPLSAGPVPGDREQAG
jgi:hypothetical protein